MPVGYIIIIQNQISDNNNQTLNLLRLCGWIDPKSEMVKDVLLCTGLLCLTIALNYMFNVAYLFSLYFNHKKEGYYSAT